MIKVLANDGLDTAACKILQEAGFDINTAKISQEDLLTRLNDYDVIVVRSATKITNELIEASPNLKLIVRAGSGLDNIDLDSASQKGILVQNTPGVSSQSVAELVFAHFFSLSRFLYQSNRRMPTDGADRFKELKKSFSKGHELRGKVLGIIGFGKIGQAVARMGLGLGMHILPFKLHHEDVKIEVDFFKIKDASVNIVVHCDPFEMILEQSDYITIHVPFRNGEPPILYKERFDMVKDGVIVVNTSRGGVIVEDDLLDALANGKVSGAGLDVFEGEPIPRKEILEHPKISLTPHIGASTIEAQERVGKDVANKIIDFFKVK